MMVHGCVFITFGVHFEPLSNWDLCYLCDNPNATTYNGLQSRPSVVFFYKFPSECIPLVGNVAVCLYCG
jgi:hypothetical protein